MAAGSKNAPQNRGETQKRICPSCEQERKGYILWPKMKTIYECKCGFFDSQGNPVDKK